MKHITKYRHYKTIEKPTDHKKHESHKSNDHLIIRFGFSCIFVIRKRKKIYITVCLHQKISSKVMT